MSAVWVRDPIMGAVVVHCLTEAPERTVGTVTWEGRDSVTGLDRHAPLAVATVACLCGVIRPGVSVVAYRHGMAASRCRAIAIRRGLPLPLPSVDWHSQAVALAREIVAGDVYEARVRATVILDDEARP